MFWLEKKVAHQVRPMVQVQREASLTEEERELATVLMITRRFQELEEVQLQFELEATRTTRE